MTNTTHNAKFLRCEHLENPLGLDEPRPRLSWQIADPRPGARQTAYQIVAAGRPDLLDQKPDLWDSGKVTGDQCLDIIWNGRKLKSRQRVLWCVRAWDHQDTASDWSATAAFEIGLLQPADWTAQWIGRPLESKAASQPCPFLRRQFELVKTVAQARLFVSARGLFEIQLNGRRIGRDYFTPGWTDYNKRIQYLVYDVTDQLQPGVNAAGAILADGWYAGYLAWNNNHFVYGDQLSLLFQLEVEYADGTREIIASGPEWKTAFGPLLKSDIYNGETYDARREIPGWSAPGFDDAAWQAAVLFPPTQSRPGGLPLQTGPPPGGTPHAGADRTAVWRSRLRPGPEHGGLGAHKSPRGGGTAGDDPLRRDAQRGRHPLHRQPAQGPVHRPVYLQRQRRRNL